MKSNAPWSVKGIERDAREAAKEAARREGMTVGEWLNNMIYSHGQSGAASGGEVEGLKLRDIVTAIEHLRNRIVDAEKKSTETVSSLSRNVGGVVERVQRLERVKPAQGTYDDLSARLEKLETSGGDRNRIEALKALEKAVAQVAMQFSNAQKTTLHRLDSAEQQLQEFAERIDRIGLDGDPADIKALKTTIEGLAERVTRAEKVAGEAAALNDAAASSVDPEFVEQTGARLRVLGDEIKRGGDQIRAFETAVSRLSDQIEAAEKRSSEGVQKVAETIADVREQILSEDGKDENAAAALEAKLAAAQQETDQRLASLQHSFEEMNARVQTLNEAARAAPRQPAAGPEPEAEPAPDPAAQAANQTPAQAANQTPAPNDEPGLDDIDEAVAALEAGDDAHDDDKEVDPFAFDDDLEAEADSEDNEEALEDFSFQLDEDSESAADENTGDATAPDSVGDAQSRLAKVRSALSGEGYESADRIDADTQDDTDEEIAAMLGDLEEDGFAITDQDEEDRQAPETASLTPDKEDDAPQSADEDAAEDIDATGAANADEMQAAEETTDSPPMAEPPAEENYLATARRRAKEAAASREEEAKRPTRRNLSAKQRAILAARARQKQLTAKAGDDEEPAAAEDTRPSSVRDKNSEQASEDRDDDETPTGRFAKISAALSAARSRLGRKKDDDADAAPAAKDKVAAPAAAVEETHDGDSAGRNNDRAALENLKATSSARPVTYALLGAIILAFVALAWLMKDFIFPSGDSGENTPAVTQTAQPATPSTAEDASTAAATDLPAVPEAPAIDPQALYLEAMRGLSAADTETAASEAISKLQDAAALGSPPAQLQLGELYKTGQGVEQDASQARVWFRRAANGGNVLAMHRLGVMTARGDGGAADTASAIGWFEQAANFGLVDSQYNLGAIYHPTENGGGVQDAEEAYYWYSLAARNGDDAAEPLAAGIGASLTDAERTAVDQRVSDWSALDTDPAANALSEG
ncbi:hypothetical protein [Hyphococcus sp.]|uniref:tetratricopeptide repeat protein n=1 Tax=Hyphococcus sp. TaxID=2038636 RepID=UPI003CCBDBA4